MNRSRPPAVAGSFYPSSAGELRQVIDDCFDTNPLGPKGTRSAVSTVIAGMVPHAGYVYSGPCAAHLYATLDKSIRRVILLGVNHWVHGHRAALSPWNSWQTPSGDVAVNSAINDFLEARSQLLMRDEAAHTQEHSIEVQLPLLQRVLGDFSFVPISLSSLDSDECIELGAAIAAACQVQPASGHRTCILASSDLSHYLPPKETEELDQLALERVIALDAAGLVKVVEDKKITMCGVLPVAVMLYAATALGATRARLLMHCTSGDVAPMRNVVGYASVAIEL
ncbi:MAG: AmmeMemoRadiSam system protein B [Candidatus Binatia bacterium]